MEEIIELGKVELTNSGSYVKSNVSGIGSIGHGSSSGAGMVGVGSGGTGNINTNSYITYSYPYPQTESYVVFQLPRNEMPRKVYLGGRLATVGKLGDDVQAAYEGRNKLVFKLGELHTYTSFMRITVSIEYQDMIYHYNIEHQGGIVKFKPNSNIVEAVLASEVEQ